MYNISFAFVQVKLVKFATASDKPVNVKYHAKEVYTRYINIAVGVKQAVTVFTFSIRYFGRCKVFEFENPDLPPKTFATLNVSKSNGPVTMFYLSSPVDSLYVAINVDLEDTSK